MEYWYLEDREKMKKMIDTGIQKLYNSYQREKNSAILEVMIDLMEISEALGSSGLEAREMFLQIRQIAKKAESGKSGGLKYSAILCPEKRE